MNDSLEDVDRLEGKQLIDDNINIDMWKANIEICVFHVPILLSTHIT